MFDRRWGKPTSLGSRIPLTSLLQTLAVAEHLNFRHAANTLGVAQSSVSARVKALEEELGIILFERHARGVKLTEAGRHFVGGVAAGIDQLDYAVKTAGIVARGEHSRLRVGIHALIPRSFLGRLLDRYRDLYPNIELEISERTARDRIMRLRVGALDVSFAPGAPELPDLHSRRIWTEKLFAALSAQHRFVDRIGVTWSDLASDYLIVQQGGNGPQARDLITTRLANARPDVVVQRFDVERDTLMSMVAEGHGTTIVGEAMKLIDTPGAAYLPILDEPEPLPFSAIWSPHNRSPALRKLLDLAGQMSRSAQPIYPMTRS